MRIDFEPGDQMDDATLSVRIAGIELKLILVTVMQVKIRQNVSATNAENCSFSTHRGVSPTTLKPRRPIREYHRPNC